MKYLPKVQIILFVLCIATEARSQWIQTNGPEGGPVYSILQSGSAILAGTSDGGVFRSTDNGSTWASSNNGMPIQDVEALVIKDSVIFAATGTGVFHSTNNGTSWEDMHSPGRPTLSLAVDPNSGDIFAGSLGIVAHSTDDGTSWIYAIIDSSYPQVNALILIDSNIFAGTYPNGVYRSTDRGAMWTTMNGGLSNTNVWVLAVSGKSIFAGTDSGVFRSTDQGNTWSQTGNVLASIPVGALAVDSGSIFAGSENGLFRSADNGSSWTSFGIDSSVICISLSSTVDFIGTSWGIFRTTDKGMKWDHVNTGLKNTVVRAMVVDGSNIFAGTGRNGIFLSTDDGNTWTAKNSGLTNMFVLTLDIIDSILYAGTYGGGLFRSTDGGTTWSSLNMGFTNNNVWTVASNGTYMFAGTDSGLFRSADKGKHWDPSSTGLIFTDVRTIAFYDTIMLLGTHSSPPYYSGSSIFRSTNNGDSWTWIYNDLSSDVHNFVTIDTIIFAGSERGVFYSTSNGLSWQYVNNSGLPSGWVSCLIAHGKNLFASIPDVGVFLSVNNGNNWTPVDTGLGNKNVWTMTFNQSDFFAGTFGSSVWKRPLGEMITSVKNDAQIIPSKFNLEQNYPNPFNPLTVIQYSLPVTAGVQLSIFNIAGQEVMRAVDERQHAGQYRATINASKLSTGIYFYKLQAGGFIHVKKMILIK